MNIETYKQKFQAIKDLYDSKIIELQKTFLEENMDNYNFPLGSDNEQAPWNKKDPEKKDIDVYVSITMSKSFTIQIPEDSDIEDIDLNYEVKQQHSLPQNAYKNIQPVGNMRKVISDLSGWYVDDMTTIVD